MIPTSPPTSPVSDPERSPPPKSNVVAILACVFAAFVALCALVVVVSAPKSGVGIPAPTPGVVVTGSPISTTPVTPVTTPVSTTVRTTTTLDMAEIGFASIGKAMCAKYPAGDAFDIDWCSVTPGNAKVKELIQSGCNVVDAVDPARSKSEYAIRDGISKTLALQVTKGEMTSDQALSMASLLGAVMGGREMVC